MDKCGWECVTKACEHLVHNFEWKELGQTRDERTYDREMCKV